MKIKVSRTFTSGVMKLEKTAEADFQTELFCPLDAVQAQTQESAQVESIAGRARAMLETLEPQSK